VCRLGVIVSRLGGNGHGMGGTVCLLITMDRDNRNSIWSPCIVTVSDCNTLFLGLLARLSVCLSIPQHCGCKTCRYYRYTGSRRCNTCSRQLHLNARGNGGSFPSHVPSADASRDIDLDHVAIARGGLERSYTVTGEWWRGSGFTGHSL
jgi:hypothetical protein